MINLKNKWIDTQCAHCRHRLMKRPNESIAFCVFATEHNRVEKCSGPGSEFRCPGCGNSDFRKTGESDGRLRYDCPHCGKKFSKQFKNPQATSLPDLHPEGWPPSILT